MSNNKPAIYKTIKAAYTLSQDQGATQGERDAAKAMFEKLCAKHGCLPSDFSETNLYTFTIANAFERTILTQCICKVLKAREFNWVKTSRKAEVRLAPNQYLEVDRLYQHYRNVWKQEVENLMVAFLNKHNLFSGVKSDSPSTITLEKLRQMIQMMGGLDDAPLPALALGDGK